MGEEVRGIGWGGVGGLCGELGLQPFIYFGIVDERLEIIGLFWLKRALLD
jgi:hypothetical protein